MCDDDGMPHLSATPSRVGWDSSNGRLVMSVSSTQILPVTQDTTFPCNHDCRRWRLLQASFGRPVRSYAPAAVSVVHNLPARKALHGQRCHPVRSSTRNEQAESSSFKAGGDPLCESHIYS